MRIPCLKIVPHYEPSTHGQTPQYITIPTHGNRARLEQHRLSKADQNRVVLPMVCPSITLPARQRPEPRQASPPSHKSQVMTVFRQEEQAWVQQQAEPRLAEALNRLAR